MENQNFENQPFVFYLTLDEVPPKEFYPFAEQLKQQGFLLLPVKLDQIQSLMSVCEQDQIMIICSVNSSIEFKNYQIKIRKYLKNILQSKRVTFLHLSPFDKLNDQKAYHMLKNYYFIKFPVNVKRLSQTIGQYYHYKKNEKAMWPGGKRSQAISGLA